MHIKIFIGHYHNISEGFVLNDSSPPETQINHFKALLKSNINTFCTNSPYILAYCTCLMYASGLDNYNNLDEYPVKVKSGELIECKENGEFVVVDNYENMFSDNNLLNNALALGNEKFSELLEFENNINN